MASDDDLSICRTCGKPIERGDARYRGVDGPTFYGEVQQRYPDIARRIVFMTAHQNVEEFVPFLKGVGSPVLQKPFSVEELRSTVARIAGPPSTRPRPYGPTNYGV